MQKGVAVNGSEFPAVFLALWGGVGLGGICRARAWSARPSLALPPDFIPADSTEPTETFYPFQAGALFKMLRIFHDFPGIYTNWMAQPVH